MTSWPECLSSVWPAVHLDSRNHVTATLRWRYIIEGGLLGRKSFASGPSEWLYCGMLGWSRWD